MSSDHNDREQLGRQAEAYDRLLSPDSGVTVDSDTAPGFESGNPKLAKTLRLLRSVFPRPAATALIEQGGDVLPPTEIDRFTLKERLGSGSFGSVWLAYDPLLKRDVAVKVAHVGVHASANLLERFQREAHLAARLHHPNIVPVFETGEDGGRVFIVSEYCAGRTLGDWLQQRPDPVEADFAAELLRQLADAADHAHQQGLIHRDIKPGNVLLSSDRSVADKFTPRLTDFGLARDLTAEQSSTRTGELLGTVKYMSPEQARGSAADQGPRTDVYSLGVLLYLMTTGRPPFTGDNDFAVMQQIVAAEPVPPSRLNAQVPRDLSAICLKCLEKDPEQRYPSAAELCQDLDRFLRQEPTLARPIPVTERLVRWAKRTPAVASLVVLLPTVLLAAVIGLSLYLQQVARHANDLTLALTETQRARDDATEAQNTAEAQREYARATRYRSDMRLAFDLWQRGEIHTVRDLLTDQFPGQERDVRGPEWFLLAADYAARFRQVAHLPESVNECVMSPDGTTFWTCGGDGCIRVWDSASARETACFQLDMGQLHALALSPDGATLAVGGEPRLPRDLADLILVNAGTGQVQATVQSHFTNIESADFSADGKWLVAGSRYQPVQLTRLSDQQTTSLESGRRNRAVSFSSDSRYLCVSADRFHTRIWQLDDGSPTPVFDAAILHERQPEVSRFLPGRNLLVSAYSNLSDLTYFDHSGRSVVATLSGQSHGTLCLNFSPNATLTAAGDASGRISVWKPDFSEAGTVTTGNRPFAAQHVFHAHSSGVRSVSVANDSTLISTGEDGRVVVIRPEASGARRFRFPEMIIREASLAGSQLVLAFDDGSIRKCDVSELRQGRQTGAADDKLKLQVLVPAENQITSLTTSHHGLLAAGTSRGGVTVCDITTGTRFHALVDNRDSNEPDSSVATMCFSLDGTKLATNSENGIVRIHDVQTGEELLATTVGHLRTMQFLPGDERIACGGEFEELRVIDSNTGRLTQSIEGGDIFTLALDPERGHLLSTHWNGMVQILDADSLQARHLISGDSDPVGSAVFSAGSRSIISFNSRGNLHIVNVGSGRSIGHLSLPDFERPHSVAYTILLQTHDLLIAVVGYDDDGHSDVYAWDLASEPDLMATSLQ